MVRKHDIIYIPIPKTYFLRYSKIVVYIIRKSSYRYFIFHLHSFSQLQKNLNIVFYFHSILWNKSSRR